MTFQCKVCEGELDLITLQRKRFAISCPKCTKDLEAATTILTELGRVLEQVSPTPTDATP